jgi:flagellar motility protein MotE (MotC chaperone)
MAESNEKKSLLEEFLQLKEDLAKLENKLKKQLEDLKEWQEKVDAYFPKR